MTSLLCGFTVVYMLSREDHIVTNFIDDNEIIAYTWSMSLHN
jgi:hypothetical protein